MTTSIGFGLTDIGCRRISNEDSLAVDNSLGVYAVSDGMGGHAAGEIASQMAVVGLMRRLREHRATLARARCGTIAINEVAELLKRAVVEVSEEIYHVGVNCPEYRGMGCTLTAATVIGDIVICAHVGDSRLLKVHHHDVEQITHDHNLAAELVDAGVLKPEDAARCRFSNVLSRAIGTNPDVNPDIIVLPVETGDRLLLCSDGLTRYFDPSCDLEELLHGDLQKVPGTLIEWAKQSGGDDNIAVLVVDIVANPVVANHQSDPKHVCPGNGNSLDHRMENQAAW